MQDQTESPAGKSASKAIRRNWLVAASVFLTGVATVVFAILIIPYVHGKTETLNPFLPSLIYMAALLLGIAALFPRQSKKKFAAISILLAPGAFFSMMFVVPSLYISAYNLLVPGDLAASFQTYGTR